MNEILNQITMDEKRQKKTFKKGTGRIVRHVLFYNLILFAVVFCFTIFQTAGFLMQSPNLTPSDNAMSDFMENLSSSGISSIAGVLIGVGFYILWERKNITGRDIFKSGKKIRPSVFLGFLSLLIMIQLLSSIFSFGMENLFNFFGYTMKSSMEAATESSSTLSMFLYTGIVAPVAEELVYRGFVMRSLEKYGTFFAILFSSVLFGVMHGNLAQIFFAIAAGLVFGYLAMEYSIIWSLLLHILNNLVFSDLLGRFTEHLPEIPANLISYGVLGIFTVTACIFLYKKRKGIRTWMKEHPLSSQYCFWAFTGFWFLLFTILEFVSAFSSLSPVSG